MTVVYSHRNRQSEPPTIEGEFWFDGAGFAEEHVFKWRERFEIVRSQGELWALYDQEGGLSVAVRNMAGLWSGPIIAPWDEA